MYDKQPLKRELSGLGVEYRIASLYSRDRGKREAVLGFNVGRGRGSGVSQQRADSVRLSAGGEGRAGRQGL